MLLDGTPDDTMGGPEDMEEQDLKLERTLHRRTADIISRIVIDPGFAKLVKTLRISASVRAYPSRRGASASLGRGHLSFQISAFFLVGFLPSGCVLIYIPIAMLLSALPKLVNMQELIFSGSVEVWNIIATQLSSTHPRLASLTVEYVTFPCFIFIAIPPTS